MAINFTPDDVASGFNLTKLNNNFDKVDTALQDALSRSGTGPNQMEADIDLNSNDLLNVKRIDVNEIILDGVNVIPSQLADAGFFIRRFETLADATTFQIPQNVERVYVEDREAFYKRSSVDEGLAGFTASDGDFWKIDEPILRPVMFTIVGNGSDETTKLQAMLDYAEQETVEEVVLVPNANYGITAITIKPRTKVRAKGVTFTKLAASTTYAITINEYVSFDHIVVSTPGGAPDRGVQINGEFVIGDLLQVVADAECDGFAIHIEGSSQLNGIRLGKLTTGNFSSQIQTFSVRRLWIDEIQMVGYVTGLYVRDAFRCHYGKVFASGTHSAADGGPGNNGVLMESVANDYAVDDVTFDDITIKDSAEHAFRIGGALIVRGVYIKSLKAFNTAALVGVSTGGAAFKALLNDVNPGRHQDIRVDSLYFEDTGTTMGVGNHTAIQIYRCQDVVIMNPVGRKRGKAWSCIQGFGTNGSTRVKIVNPDIQDCNGVIGDFGVSTLPVSLEGMTDISIIGGILHTLSTGTCVSMHGSGGINASLDAPFNNVSFLDKVKIMGGNTSVRYQDITGAGSYSNMVLDVEYSQPNAVPAGGVWQAVPATLDSNLTVRFISDIATPVSSRARDGSTWISTGDNSFKIKINAVWRPQLYTEQSTYTPVAAIVANLDAATPSLSQFTRIGDIVQVTGQVTFDATAGGTITARLTLPVPSAFTLAREASGTFDSADGTVHGSITADAATDQVTFSGNSSVTSARTCAFTYTYVVV